MILKGIISKVNEAANTAEVMLPEYDNAVTSELPFYGRTSYGVKAGDFAIVALFNGGNDLADGVIL